MSAKFGHSGYPPETASDDRWSLFKKVNKTEERNKQMDRARISS